MKTYSDLQAIDTDLAITVTLEPVGNPDVLLLIDKKILAGGVLYKSVTVETAITSLESFWISVELRNKVKIHPDQETAVQIKLQVDGIDILPRFDYLAVYTNDHNDSNPTSYLGYNGKWTLTFDRPFYQWLHQATGQGWLLS